MRYVLPMFLDYTTIASIEEQTFRHVVLTSRAYDPAWLDKHFRSDHVPYVAATGKTYYVTRRLVSAVSVPYEQNIEPPHTLLFFKYWSDKAKFLELCPDDIVSDNPISTIIEWREPWWKRLAAWVKTGMRL